MSIINIIARSWKFVKRVQENSWQSKIADSINAAAYSDDEDCGDLLVVSRGTSWLDTYKACDYDTLADNIKCKVFIISKVKLSCLMKLWRPWVMWEIYLSLEEIWFCYDIWIL